MRDMVAGFIDTASMHDVNLEALARQLLAAVIDLEIMVERHAAMARLFGERATEPIDSKIVEEPSWSKT